MPQIIKRTEQCKDCMQIAWVKLKLFYKAVIVALFVEMESSIVTKLLILFHLISRLLLTVSN